MDFYIYLYAYPTYCRDHNFYLNKLLILLPNLELLCVMFLMQNLHVCLYLQICMGNWPRLFGLAALCLAQHYSGFAFS